MCRTTTNLGPLVPHMDACVCVYDLLRECGDHDSVRQESQDSGVCLSERTLSTLHYTSYTSSVVVLDWYHSHEKWYHSGTTLGPVWRRS